MERAFMYGGRARERVRPENRGIFVFDVYRARLPGPRRYGTGRFPNYYRRKYGDTTNKAGAGHNALRGHGSKRQRRRSPIIMCRPVDIEE